MRKGKGLEIWLPDNLKLWLSKKILDWTEEWPQFQGGYIHSLQSRRKSQRKEAIDAYNRTRPPEGTELEFLGIRLVEVFQYEDFGQVPPGLLRLFPGLGKSQYGQSFKMRLQQLSERITGGGGTEPLGYLYRDKPWMWPPGTHFQMTHLPPEVEYIQVGLYIFLPSLLFITFDVFLNEDASKKLNQLQNSHYLSDVTIQTLYFDGFWGMSQNTSDGVMQREILKWLEKIRESIESCIRPYLSGYFMEQTKAKTRLPAIEIFGIKGCQKNHDDFVSWAKNSRQWWKSLSFEFYYSLYGDRKVLFNWVNHSSKTPNQVHRIIVLWEEYINSIHPEADNERHAIFRDVQNFLDTILTPLTAINYLNTLVVKIAQLRGTIFSSMKSSGFSRSNMHKQIQLYSKLQREIISLDRLSLEFKQNEDWFRHELAEIEEVVSIRLNPEKDSPQKRFSDDLFSGINRLQKSLQDHTAFIDKTLSTFIEFLNIDAVYKLQSITLLFTIVATLFSIVATIAGFITLWPAIKDILKYLPFDAFK